MVKLKMKLRIRMSWVLWLIWFTVPFFLLSVSVSVCLCVSLICLDNLSRWLIVSTNFSWYPKCGVLIWVPSMSVYEQICAAQLKHVSVSSWLKQRRRFKLIIDLWGSSFSLWKSFPQTGPFCVSLPCFVNWGCFTSSS